MAEGLADPWQVSAGEGFAKGGPQCRSEECLGYGGVTDKAPCDAVSGHLGRSEIVGDHQVVAVEDNQAGDLEDEELASALQHSAGCAAFHMLQARCEPRFVEKQNPDQCKQIGTDEGCGGGGNERYQAGVKVDQDDDGNQIKQASDSDEDIGNTQLLVAAQDLGRKARRHPYQKDGQSRGNRLPHGRGLRGGGEMKETIPVERRPDPPCDPGEQQGYRQHDPEGCCGVGAGVLTVIPSIGLGDKVGKGVCDSEIEHEEHGEGGRDGYPYPEILRAEIPDRDGNGNRAGGEHDSFADHARGGALQEAPCAVLRDRG